MRLGDAYDFLLVVSKDVFPSTEDFP